MFCKNCGTQNQDGARFCAGCGADLTPAPAQPVYQAPVQQAPVQQAPVQPAPQLKLNPKTVTTLIVVVITIMSLIFGILSTFGLYEVEIKSETVTKSGSNKETDKSSGEADLEDYYEVYLENWGDRVDEAEEADSELTGGPVFVLIGNLVFGIVNLLIAVAGVLYLLKLYMGMPYYDMILGAVTKGKAPTKLMALAGAVASLIQMLLLWIFPMKSVVKMGEDTTITTTNAVQVNAMTWIMLILCVLIIVVDFLKNNKNKMPRPVATYPQQ